MILKVLCIKTRKKHQITSNQTQRNTYSTIIITSKGDACLIRLQQVRNFQKKIYRWLSNSLSIRLLNVLADCSWYLKAASWIEIVNEITCVYGWFKSLIFMKKRGTEQTFCCKPPSYVYFYLDCRQLWHVQKNYLERCARITLLFVIFLKVNMTDISYYIIPFQQFPYYSKYTF